MGLTFKMGEKRDLQGSQDVFACIPPRLQRQFPQDLEVRK